MMVERISGSPEGMALKDKLKQDNIGATGQSASPAYLAPPGNIYQRSYLYRSDGSYQRVVSQELERYSRKPRVAYLTADSTLGRGIVIPEMKLP
jgi:hypothetical protein